MKVSETLKLTLEYLEMLEGSLVLDMEGFTSIPDFFEAKKDNDSLIDNRWCSNCKDNTDNTKLCYFLNKEQDRRDENNRKHVKLKRIVS